MAIRIYNTLSRRVDDWETIEPHVVRMYTCGPTTYSFQHIGNLRAVVVPDVFRRFLESEHFHVRHVRNVTDVGHLTSDGDTGEDKMEIAIKREQKTPEEITSFYLEKFHEDLRALMVEPPVFECKATEHVSEMIALIKRLEKNGFTYQTPEGVFFDTTKFSGYEKFARLKMHGQKKAARTIDDLHKKNAADFALWFTNKPNHVQQWDAPWGRGFPGWHIECSAMAMKYLGEQIDVHFGGIEHIPVHHTNEIAQAEAATGKRPFSRYFVHYEHLNLETSKMSKSLGNVILLSDITAREFDALDFRYFLLLHHYRSEIKFSWKGLEKAKSGRGRLQNVLDRLHQRGGTPKRESENINLCAKTKNDIQNALSNDLDTPKALRALHGFANKANAALDSGKWGKNECENALQLFRYANEILRVLHEGKSVRENIPQNVLGLVAEREIALKTDIRQAAEAGEFEKVQELEGRLVSERKALQAELEERERAIAVAKKESQSLKTVIGSLRQEKASLEAGIKETREKVGTEMAKITAAADG